MKLNSRCFIRDGVTSIIFTEVILKLCCVEVVSIAYNIQYLWVYSFVHITFFITSQMSGFEPTKHHIRETLLLCFNLKTVLLKVIAKCKKAWVLPGEPGPSSPKRNIHAQKVMLCTVKPLLSYLIRRHVTYMKCQSQARTSQNEHTVAFSISLLY